MQPDSSIPRPQPQEKNSMASDRLEAAKKDLSFDGHQSWNDVVWLVLFIAHIIGLIVAVVMLGLPTQDETNLPESQEEQPENSQFRYDVFIIMLVLSSLTGIITSFAWFAALERYPTALIKISIAFSLVCGLVIGIFALVDQQLLLGIHSLVFVLILAGWTFLVRKRIPFSSHMLELSANLLTAYSGPIFVAFGFLLLTIGWIIFSAFSSYIIASAAQTSAVVLPLMLSFFWGIEVLRNIVHVTTSGVAATWWFFGEPRRPTLGALKRAVTTSLGSICFGSLLIAILRTIKQMLQSANTDNALVARIIVCLLDLLEEFVRYINAYTLSRVAIHGTPFWKSGKETFELFHNSLFDAFVNDNLIGYVCGLGSVLGFALSFLVSWAWLSWNALDVQFAFFGGLIGFLMMYVITSVIQSSIVTFFILWSEHPHALQQTRPDSYLKLRDAVAQTYADIESVPAQV